MASEAAALSENSYHSYENREEKEEQQMRWKMDEPARESIANSRTITRGNQNRLQGLSKNIIFIEKSRNLSTTNVLISIKHFVLKDPVAMMQNYAVAKATSKPEDWDRGGGGIDNGMQEEGRYYNNYQSKELSDNSGAASSLYNKESASAGELCPCTSTTTKQLTATVAGQDNPFYQHDMNYYNNVAPTTTSSGGYPTTVTLVLLRA